MNWEEYGAACRESGSIALQVFACQSAMINHGPPPADVMQRHKAYVKDMEAQGKLFLAGPLSDETGTQMGGKGLLVFRADTIEEARALADGDPMHSEGVRSYTLTAWRLNEGMPIPGIRFSTGSFSL